MEWDVYVRLVEETQKSRIAIGEIVEACLKDRYGNKPASFDGSAQESSKYGEIVEKIIQALTKPISMNDSRKMRG